MVKTRTRMLLLYQARFLLRTAVLALVAVLYFLYDRAFDAAQGGFFKALSPMHLLWALWMVDMIFQLFPSRGLVAMGCQKMFRTHAVPSGAQPTAEEWKAWRKENRRGAALVAASWLVLTAAIAVLRFAGVLRTKELVLLSAIFYVCVLICVLFWCPFQKLMMKNRCCTTCRIFNWDHIMMFTPMAFLGSFFALSLFGMSLVVLVVWELQYARHPELFWDKTNAALRCSNCSDKLCTIKRHCSAKARAVAAGAVSAAAGVASTAAAVSDKAAAVAEITAGAVAEAAQNTAAAVTRKRKLRVK